MKKKTTAFLRFIIFYKALAGVIELILSVSFFNLLDKDLGEVFTRIAVNNNLDMDNQIVGAVIKKAGMIGNGTILGAAFVILVIGILNLVEAYGLHLKQRWAEWLTVFATSLLIPFEVYHVIAKVSFFKLIILILNVAIVYYLARHKELFKSRKEARADLAN